MFSDGQGPWQWLGCVVVQTTLAWTSWTVTTPCDRFGMASPHCIRGCAELLAGHFSPGLAAERWTEFFALVNLKIDIFLVFQAPAASPP